MPESPDVPVAEIDEPDRKVANPGIMAPGKILAGEKHFLLAACDKSSVRKILRKKAKIMSRVCDIRLTRATNGSRIARPAN